MNLAKPKPVAIPINYHGSPSKHAKIKCPHCKTKSRCKP